MNTNQQFFYDNAGFSYDPKTQTPEQGHIASANTLALCEQWAMDQGISFSWEIDDLCDSSDFSNTRPYYQLWCCFAHNADGEIIDSLGGVDFGRNGTPWSNPYKRVIEAEISANCKD